MPTYSIDGPDGKTYSIEGPEGATREQVIAKIKEKQPDIAAPKDQRGGVEKLLGIGGERYQTWPERLVRGVVGGVEEGLEKGATLTKEALTDPAKYSQDVRDPANVLPAASLGMTGAPGAASALAKPVFGFGESLSRTYPESLQRQAVNKVTARLEQAGTTAAEAIEKVNAANAAGKPMTLADVSGKPVERLAGNVYRSGGEATEVADKFLGQRDKEAGARLSQDISKYVHGGPSMHQTTEALLTARSQNGKPLWDQVRTMQGVWSPRLQEFIDDPTLQKGLARGYQIERLESLAEGRPFDPTQLGIDLDAEGNIKFIKAPNMRVLHMAKMGLDALIAEERNEITGRLSYMGVALEKMRQGFVGEIDRLDTSGTYKAARAAWQGTSKSLDAIREGRNVFANSPEEIAAQFAKMSPSDQEFFRIGVADKLREQLGKTGINADEARSILKNPWVESQLQPIFRSPKEFDAFVDAVSKETRMYEANASIRRGSQTAERLAEDQGDDHTMAAGGAEIAKSLASGEWLGAIRKYLRMKRDLGLRQNPELNERIAKLLFSTQPDLTAIETGSRGNYLARPAAALQSSAPALVPGAASALSQTHQSPLAQTGL
jgi:hypothetical protein